MCTITDETHAHLEVTPGDRREIARLLLAGAEAAGVDPANPCHVTTTTEGFRVSAEVLAASGLEMAPPPGLIDLLEELGERARASAAAEPAAEVPGPAEQTTAPRRHRRKATTDER